MRSSVYTTLVLLLACALQACGSSPTMPSPTLSGAWQGTIESEGPGTIKLQLTESGVNVTGTVSLSQDGIVDAPGTFVGTLNSASVPTSMQYTVTYTYGFDCHGSFSGTMTLTPSRMDGTYTGANCVRPFTGSLSATRQ